MGILVGAAVLQLLLLKWERAGRTREAVKATWG